MRGLQAEAEGEGDNQRREGLNRQKLREKEKIGEFFVALSNAHKIAVMQFSTFSKFSKSYYTNQQTWIKPV